MRSEVGTRELRERLNGLVVDAYNALSGSRVEYENLHEDDRASVNQAVSEFLGERDPESEAAYPEESP